MFTFACDDVCPHCGADLTKPDSIVAAVAGSLDPTTGATVQVDECGYVVDRYGCLAEDAGTDGCAPTQLCRDDPATIFSCRACLNRLDVTPEEKAFI